jgi:hypothetical protein
MSYVYRTCPVAPEDSNGVKLLAPWNLAKPTHRWLDSTGVSKVTQQSGFNWGAINYELITCFRASQLF